LAEISKIFFSETNELTEPKLYMNDHWNVLYQVRTFLLSLVPIGPVVSEKKLEM
jgi:hypothetical protein